MPRELASDRTLKLKFISHLQDTQMLKQRTSFIRPYVARGEGGGAEGVMLGPSHLFGSS